MNERTVTGALKVSPRKKVSQAGNPYAEFVILGDDGKQYVCLAFRDSGSRALSQLKESYGTKLTVFGKVKQRNHSDEDIFTVLCNTWGFADKKEQKKEKRRQASASKVDADSERIMRQRGIVYARVAKGQRGWERIEHCVEIKGVFISKIYFILEMLGAEKVNAVLKQEGVSITGNLSHWPRLREDLVGCAMTDWEERQGQ
jgi:hypothetical protein